MKTNRNSDIGVCGVGVGGGYLHAGKAMFDMQMFATFQGVEICPCAWKPCF